MSHARLTAILKYLSFLGQEQTDSQQYMLFSRHWHPCMSENIGEIYVDSGQTVDASKVTLSFHYIYAKETR